MNITCTKQLVAEQYIGTNIHDIIDFIDGWHHDGLELLPVTEIEHEVKRIDIYLRSSTSDFCVRETDWVLWDDAEEKLWVETDENFKKYYQKVPNE